MDRTIYSVELPKRPGVEKFDTFMGMDVIAQLDGEKHDRLRRLLSQPFSPGAVQALHGAIENHVDDLIDRSEEHTSELQSLMRISYAVFCLKKKINKYK